MKKFLTLAFLAALNTPSVLAATYEIDADHSTVSFRIRHLLSQVQGSFRVFSGKFEYEPSKSGDWRVGATIESKSIITNSEKRDNHLRSSDFFDTDKNPKIEFTSSGSSDLKKTKDGEKLKLQGQLTIRGVTKPIVLDVETKGIAKDPWGNTVMALTAKTKINRKDFGISWNKALDKGGVLLGDDVEIQLDIEARQK